MKILLLGSNNESTAFSYKQYNLPQSILVTSINQDYTVGHTSRQEFFSDIELETVLANADLVYWTFPKVSEFSSNNTEYYELLNWLKDYQLKYKNIKNFSEIDQDPYSWKIKVPKLTHNDAVFLGCSFTAGSALPGDKNNRYAEIVAKHFNKNCVNLAKDGGSNNRSLDIFSQLEFAEKQIVVLQLTSLERLRYVSEDKKIHDLMFSRTPNSKDFLKIYHRDFLLYELLIKLRLVVSMARTKKLRFLFWLIDYKNDLVYSIEDQTYFYNCTEFIPKSMMENYLVDFGTDGLHPGIESNKIIANTIISYMNQIYDTV